MRPDIAELGAVAALTDPEYDIFRKAVRILLSRTFIIRGYEKEERLYDFAIRNISLLEAWFSCADITLARDEGLGVIACRSGAEMRTRLSRDETCALLVLRLLFEEKRTEIHLASFPSVTVLDFLQRYRALTDRDLPKTRLADILKRLCAYRLIDTPADPTDPDAPVILYPSLALTLDQAAIREIEDAIKQEDKLRSNAGTRADSGEGMDSADAADRIDDTEVPDAIEAGEDSDAGEYSDAGEDQL